MIKTWFYFKLVVFYDNKVIIKKKKRKKHTEHETLLRFSNPILISSDSRIENKEQMSKTHKYINRVTV